MAVAVLRVRLARAQQPHLDERDRRRRTNRIDRQRVAVAELAAKPFCRCRTAAHEALAGPPLVVTATMSNTWNEPMTVSTVTSARMGRSSGRVRRRTTAARSRRPAGRPRRSRRNRLQAGEDDERGVAHVPHLPTASVGSDPLRGAEEADVGPADRVHDPVDDADLGVEHPLPDQRGDDAGHQERQQHEPTDAPSSSSPGASAPASPTAMQRLEDDVEERRTPASPPARSRTACRRRS